MFLYSVGTSGTMSKQDILSLTLPQVNNLLRSIAKTNKKIDKKQQSPGVTMTTPAMMKKMQEEYRKKMGLE